MWTLALWALVARADIAPGRMAPRPFCESAPIGARCTTDAGAPGTCLGSMPAVPEPAPAPPTASADGFGVGFGRLGGDGSGWGTARCVPDDVEARRAMLRADGRGVAEAAPAPAAPAVPAPAPLAPKPAPPADAGSAAGCGCTTSSPSSPWWLALLLGARRRR